MKQAFLFFVSLLILLGSAVAVEALDVVITPSSPDTDDALKAYVKGYESTTFDFYWMKDGDTYKTGTGTSSTLAASYTDAGDTWTVSVWTPESAWYDSYEVGDESVIIAGEAPSTSDGNVIIEPSDACTDDDLRAYVEGYESTVFDFYWMKDGATYKTSTGTSSTLPDSYTDAGDVWTVVVWVPESAWYDSFEYGRDSVEIQDCAEGEVPEYPDGQVVIEPSDACDEDDLQAYVEGYESDVFDFYWSMGGVTYYTSAGTYSILDASYTDVGDVWTVSAWVPESSGYDSFEVDRVSITIQDCAEDDNRAPRAADIQMSIEEGDFVDVDLKQFSTLISYSLYATLAQSREMTNVPAYDADGDVLSISYDRILDANGQWQTVEGDAGVYVVIGTVSDGLESTDVNIRITVDAAEVVDTEAPLVTDIYFSVEEGDLALVEVVYTDNYATYLLAEYTRFFYEENTIYVYDADSVESDLAYSFAAPFDANGQWQTVEGSAGVYISSLSVTDLEGNIGVGTITLTVEAPEDTDGDNTAPVLEDIADIEINEGESLSVTAVASDADGDPLSYIFSGIPEGSISGSTWAWTTSFVDAGQYDITVTVSDGQASDSTSFIVKVNDVDTGEEEVHRSDYEGDLLEVSEVRVLNADSLYSAYDVSDMDLEASGVFSVEDGYLQSTGSDNEIKVFLAMHNRNSFDADDISVTFIFDGEEYFSSFSDLDRSEEESQIYSIAIPEDLETGKYALRVIVESDDISYEKAFNLNVVSLGDYIAQPVTEEDSVREAVTSFKEKVKNLFAFLF
ncbi:MAG: hypothetical protein Q8R18_03290 [bacterium]|nr:hypothetical protein [bacterium]